MRFHSLPAFMPYIQASITQRTNGSCILHAATNSHYHGTQQRVLNMHVYDT